MVLGCVCDSGSNNGCGDSTDMALDDCADGMKVRSGSTGVGGHDISIARLRWRSWDRRTPGEFLKKLP